MFRYTVYREYINGKDGDRGFDTEKDAESDFYDAVNDERVVKAELLYNLAAEEFNVPCILKTYDATRNDS